MSTSRLSAKSESKRRHTLTVVVFAGVAFLALSFGWYLIRHEFHKTNQSKFITKVESCNIEDVFREKKVVPDLIQRPPPLPVDVTYEVLDDAGEQTQIQVQCGQELDPMEARYTPKVIWKADSTKYYTLIMFDPDAPSPKDPTKHSWCHWLVGNIPSKTVNKGDEIFSYNGPTPPPDSGFQRYVFLVYQQPAGGIKFDFSPERENFNVTKLAQDYQLGDPKYGNIFIARA